MPLEVKPVIETDGRVVHDILGHGGLPEESKLALARANLDDAVRRGAARSSAVVQRILSEVPRDDIVRGERLQFGRAGGRLAFGVGDQQWLLHNHAFEQLVERAGVPTAYARRLDAAEAEADGTSWEHRLLEYTLDQHYRHQGGRYLVRSVGGQARGILSDKFRRLDSRPLLDAFLGEAQKVGAVPFEGVASDVRVSVRAIIPTVHEPVPGEFMVFGLSWQNSDYGAGMYGVSAFVLRLLCLNAAIGESVLKQVHLGKRLPEELTFSQQTYELDTRTMISATRDVIGNILAPKAIEARLDAVRQAHAQETSWNAAFKKVGQLLSKGEAQRAKEAFEGPDNVMLPEGKTALRFSNALSWIANQTEDADRKIELQRIAGAVLEKKAA
jgi:hypothetical protein